MTTETISRNPETETNFTEMFSFLNGERPVVLIDMDGVVADWQQMFDKLLGEQYPHINRVPFDQVTSFKTQSFYADEYKDDIKEMMNTEGFYRDLEVHEGAVEALHELNKHVEVFFCTAPYLSNKTCASEKIAWVEEHFGKDWKERVVLASDKTLVNGMVLVDDKPNITGNMTPMWEHIVFDAPYNRDMPLRINHWDEGVAVIADTLKTLMEKN